MFYRVNVTLVCGAGQESEPAPIIDPHQCAKWRRGARGPCDKGTLTETPGLAAMPPANDDKSNELHATLAGLGLVGTIVMVMIVSALQLVDALGPRIGDIIRFDPARAISPDGQTSFKVTPLSGSAGGPCRLNPSIMAASGGSLMIEATSPEPDRAYRVRWAGRRTSNGPADCGPAGVFLLSQPQLITLKLASGH